MTDKDLTCQNCEALMRDIKDYEKRRVCYDCELLAQQFLEEINGLLEETEDD